MAEYNGYHPSHGNDAVPVRAESEAEALALVQRLVKLDNAVNDFDDDPTACRVEPMSAEEAETLTFLEAIFGQPVLTEESISAWEADNGIVS